MSRKGFTLIELLVVISIVALLSSVVLASLNSAREKSRLAAGKQFEANVYHASADQALGIWDFDDCTGTGIVATTVVDSSGNGNNGSPTGSPTWSADTPSGKGCSLSLNGTSQYVNVGTASSLDVGSTFTVSAWVKISSAPSTWNFILAGPSNDAGVGINPGLGGSIRLTKVNIIDASAATKGIVIGAWHQVAVVFSSGTVSYYMDGQIIGKSAFAQTFTAGQKRIGMNISSGGYLAGLVDDVRLYAKDLTAYDIGKLYAEDISPGKDVAKSHAFWIF